MAHWTSRLRPSHSCSDADWDSYLDAKQDHANPEDAWERREKCCPWCGDAPKAEDEDRCIACLEQKAEKEADAPPVYDLIAITARLDPRVARILSGSSIPPAPAAPPVDGSEPARGGSGSPDNRSVLEICADILRIANRMKGTP